MMKNENGIDRSIRFVVGASLLYMGYAFSSGGVQIALYIIGTILVFTAITGFCLLYQLLGISTMKNEIADK